MSWLLKYTVYLRPPVRKELEKVHRRWEACYRCAAPYDYFVETLLLNGIDHMNAVLDSKDAAHAGLRYMTDNESEVKENEN